jgi:hypothetical protein
MALKSRDGPKPVHAPAAALDRQHVKRRWPVFQRSRHIRDRVADEVRSLLRLDPDAVPIFELCEGARDDANFAGRLTRASGRVRAPYVVPGRLTSLSGG